MAPSRARRPARDLLAGVAAIAALLVLTAGVPAALVTAFGLPVPHVLPAMSLLTRRLDVFAILKICSVIVWLAWLQLVFCVFAEVRAAMRNTGMPARVPLAGGTQAGVHRLVTTVLLAFSAATALAPALPHATPPQATRMVASSRPELPHLPGAARQHSRLPGAASEPGGDHPAAARHQPRHEARARHTRRTEKIYVVQPPVGRFHESLWEIAQNHLGDGRRYPDIFALNRNRPQPDGSRLTISSLIRPGWILRMPGDAHGPGIQVVTIRDGSAARNHGSEAGDAETHGPAPATQQSAPRQDAPAPRQDASEPRPAAGRPAPRQDASAPRPAASRPAYPSELAAATLLAADVLSALGRRRREQLWRRAFGRRIAAPPAEAATAEAALRLGANELPALRCDTGLRYLSQELARQGRMLPVVFAAHVGKENLDLWIAGADHDAPAPWVAVGDGHVWRLQLAAAPGLSVDPAFQAPYPALVPIGADATGQLLADMASARGLIALTGPEPKVRSALAAMALALITSRWSKRALLTLVDFGEDLAEIDPGRVTAVPALGDALAALEEAPPVTVGAPHCLISAAPPSSEQELDRLLSVALARQDAAYVIAGKTGGAAWNWEITEEGRLRAAPLGFDVQAQLLPPEQRAWVVDLFRAAADHIGAPLGAPPPDAAPAEHLAPGAVMPVEVTLLGQTSVRAPGVIEPGQLALATELVAYLATHRGGVHPSVLAGAIWPRGVTRGVAGAMLAQVAEWLGADDIGRPHLATDAGGRLRLGSQVRVDWHVFRALLARAGQARAGSLDAAANGPGADDEASLLAQALTLVSGPFMDGRERGRYAWLASDGLEFDVEARVADAAHRLCELRLAAGDPYGAMEAVRPGLRLASGDEMLWRDLLAAAHATGHEGLLRDVAEEVRARPAPEEGLPRMAPETEALIGELLASWPSSVA